LKSEVLQQDSLMPVRLGDTLEPDVHPLSGWQNHIGQFDAFDLIEDFPGFIAESALFTHLGQTFPQHIG